MVDFLYIIEQKYKIGKPKIGNVKMYESAYSIKLST